MKTSSERVAAHRAKRLAEGWAIVHCQIPPDAAKCLADLTARQKFAATKTTRADIIARAIRFYASGGKALGY